MLLKIGDRSKFKMTALSLYLRSGIPTPILQGRHFCNLNKTNALRICRVETRAKKIRSLSATAQKESLSKIAWKKPAVWFVGADFSHQQLDIVGAWFIQQWLIANYRGVDEGKYNGSARFHTLDGTFNDELRDEKKYPNMLVLSGVYNNIESARRGKLLDILGATTDRFVVVLIRGSDPLDFAYNELSHLAARYLYLNPEICSKWRT